MLDETGLQITKEIDNTNISRISDQNSDSRICNLNRLIRISVVDELTFMPINVSSSTKDIDTHS